MQQDNKYFLLDFVFVVTVVVISLFVIKVFNISYPLTITTTTKSSELSVVGQGKVEVVPDLYTVSTGIRVDNKKTVAEVQNEINKINNQLIERLKELGVKKEDIKTVNYSVFPKQVWDKDGNSRIDGYSGSAEIRIKTKDLNLLSKITEEVVSAGANEIYGINFEVEKPEIYQELARTKAIENAKLQANKLAKDLGIRLGKITNIVEGSNPGIYSRSLPVTGGGDLSKAPSFEPGTQTITSTVTLYFEKY